MITPFVASRLLRAALAALLIAQVPQVWAQESSNLSFSRAVEKTLDKHPELRRLKLVENKLAWQVKQAGLRPELELEIEVENFGGGGQFSGTDSAESSIALSSVLELGGKRSARRELASAELSHNELIRKAQTLDLVGELSEVFITCLSIQEKILLAREQVELLEDVLKTVQKRSDRGIAPEADLMQAKVALAKAKINLNSLEQEFERRKLLLAGFWGNTQPEFDRISANLFEFGTEKSFEALLDQAKTAPDFRALITSERLGEASITLEKANSSPGIEWKVGIKQMEDVDESALIVGVSMPLFSGKRSRSNVAIAQLNRDSLNIEKESMILKMHSQLFMAYSLRSQHVLTVDQLTDEIVPSLEKALLAIQKGYENGRYRYSDLVKAQEDLIEAKQNKIDSAMLALLSQSVIERLTGVSLAY